MHPGRTSPFHDFKLRNHEQEFNEDNKDPGRHHSSAGPHRAGRQCHPFSPRQTSLLATADSKSPSALCFPAHPPFPHFSKPSPVQPLATHKGRRTRPETATMHALGPTDPRPNRTRKPPRHSAARLRHGRRGRPETGTNTELDAPDPPGCQAGSATTPFDFVSRLLPTTSQLRAGRGSRRNGRPIFPRGR